MGRSCAKYVRVLAVALALTITASAAAEEKVVEDRVGSVISGFVFDASPTPTPKEGRVSTSLRLTDTLWTTDDSHLPAMKELRFELDRGFRLDLSDVPRCGWTSMQPPSAFDWDSCEKAEVASGPLRFELLRPEEPPVKVSAAATTYNSRRGTILIQAELADPIDEEIVIPVQVSRVKRGVFGPRLTAAIPEVAEGRASLIYIGMRFRRGLFSVACPKGRLQSRVSHTFVDGERSFGALRSAC